MKHHNNEVKMEETSEPPECIEKPLVASWKAGRHVVDGTNGSCLFPADSVQTLRICIRYSMGLWLTHSLQHQAAWVQTPALLLTSSMMIAKWLNLSISHRVHVYSGTKKNSTEPGTLKVTDL